MIDKNLCQIHGNPDSIISRPSCPRLICGHGGFAQILNIIHTIVIIIIITEYDKIMHITEYDNKMYLKLYKDINKSC